MLVDEHWAAAAVAHLRRRRRWLPPRHAHPRQLLLQHLMRVRRQALQMVQARYALEVTHFGLGSILHIARLIHYLLIEVVVSELEQYALEVLARLHLRPVHDCRRQIIIHRLVLLHILPGSRPCNFGVLVTILELGRRHLFDARFLLRVGIGRPDQAEAHIGLRPPLSVPWCPLCAFVDRVRRRVRLLLRLALLCLLDRYDLLCLVR